MWKKYANIMHLKVAIGPSLNTRPVLQISEDLIDGKGPAEHHDSSWRVMNMICLRSLMVKIKSQRSGARSI